MAAGEQYQIMISRLAQSATDMYKSNPKYYFTYSTIAEKRIVSQTPFPKEKKLTGQTWMDATVELVNHDRRQSKFTITLIPIFITTIIFYDYPRPTPRLIFFANIILITDGTPRFNSSMTDMSIVI